MALEVALNGGKAKNKEEVGSTLRFDINLDSPTDNASNEVQYLELVNEKTGNKEKSPVGPFEQNEEAELAEIAKRMEEKYAAPSKKQRKIREEDLVDLGDGYDLNDPFVDDAELYEDYVPHQVDTFFGGFYINAGNLEYKRVEGEDLPTKRKQKPSLKKQMSTPKTILASKKIKLAKHQIATSAQRSETIKKKLINYTKSNPKKLSKPQTNGVSTDSVVSDESNSALVGGVTTATVQSDNKGLQPPPTLPVDLPPEVEAKVKEIETMVGKADGKLTIKARYAYDSMLLQVESECKNLKLKTKTAIFDYLAHIMGITRGSLMNRIKRTIKRNGPSTVDSPLQRLREAINEVMPACVAKYENDMIEYEAALKAEQESSKINTPGKEDFQTPLTLKPDSGGTKLKKPRKTFKWTPKLKSLLCEVVRQKVVQEMDNKERTKSGEEVIMEFLQTVIKPLWPAGWFVKRTLYNITHSVHSEFTGYQKKVAIKKEKLANEDSCMSTGTSIATSTSISLYKGSTQSSPGGNPGESITGSKQPTKVTTPTVIHNKESKGFDQSTSSSSPVIMTTNLKSTLIPSKGYLSKSDTPVDIRQTYTQSTIATTTSTKNKVASRTISPKTIFSAVTKNTSADHSVAMPTMKTSITNLQTAKIPVTQKGPTKITKISTPHNVKFSQKEINTLLQTLQNTSVVLSPQQPLQIVVQQSPKGTSPSASPIITSSKTAMSKLHKAPSPQVSNILGPLTLQNASPVTLTPSNQSTTPTLQKVSVPQIPSSSVSISTPSRKMSTSLMLSSSVIPSTTLSSRKLPATPPPSQPMVLSSIPNAAGLSPSKKVITSSPQRMSATPSLSKVPISQVSSSIQAVSTTPTSRKVPTPQLLPSTISTTSHSHKGNALPSPTLQGPSLQSNVGATTHITTPFFNQGNVVNPALSPTMKSVPSKVFGGIAMETINLNQVSTSLPSPTGYTGHNMLTGSTVYNPTSIIPSPFSAAPVQQLKHPSSYSVGTGAHSMSVIQNQVTPILGVYSDSISTEHNYAPQSAVSPVYAMPVHPQPLEAILPPTSVYPQHDYNNRKN